jgi:hypothetical protein
LLEWVSPVLAQRGELDEIRTLTGAILERGNGATLRRDAFGHRDRIADVVDAVTLGTDG